MTASTPMTAPTTGATDLDAMVARMVLGSWNGGVFDLENIRTFARRLAPFAVPDGCVIVPATAVPDAAAIRRLLEISQLAQGLLLMHGAFGQPWQDNDLGNRLTAALEAITLPHDWESTTAWLAQQGDAARTEEGG